MISKKLMLFGLILPVITAILSVIAIAFGKM
jgi:hypothetical protein